MKLTKEEIANGVVEPEDLWTTKEIYRDKDDSKINQDQQTTITSQEDEDGVEKDEYKIELVWPNVMVYIIFHTGALYGFYLGFTVAKWTTVAWCKLN